MRDYYDNKANQWCACLGANHQLAVVPRLTEKNWQRRMDSLVDAVAIAPMDVNSIGYQTVHVRPKALRLPDCPKCHELVVSVDVDAYTNSSKPALTNAALAHLRETWATGALAGTRLPAPHQTATYEVTPSVHAVTRSIRLNVRFPEVVTYRSVSVFEVDGDEYAQLIALLDTHGAAGLDLLTQLRQSPRSPLGDDVALAFDALR